MQSLLEGNNIHAFLLKEQYCNTDFYTIKIKDQSLALHSTKIPLFRQKRTNKTVAEYSRLKNVADHGQLHSF